MKMFCWAPEPFVDQLQTPEPSQALQKSTFPMPSHTVHSTMRDDSAALPIIISVPQYMQWAFSMPSGKSRLAPQRGHIAAISLTSPMNPTT
jgi:hypothetical protein